MDNKKSLEYHEEIKSYIGEKLYKKLVSAGKDILLFKDIVVKPNTSYYVKGSKSRLNQFMAYYLVRMANNGESKRPTHAKVMLQQFKEDRINHEGSPAADILFIYITSKDKSVSEKQEGWVYGTEVLNEVITRDRLGYVTVILSEIEVNALKNVEELVEINLPASKNSSWKVPVTSDNAGSEYN